MESGVVVADPEPKPVRRRGSGPVLRAVNKTIRELTTAGAINGRHAAAVELCKVMARRLDAAVEADQGAESVRLTKELRGLLADLQPRELTRVRPPAPPTGGPVEGQVSSGLAGIIGAGPELGHSPVAR